MPCALMLERVPLVLTFRGKTWTGHQKTILPSLLYQDTFIQSACAMEGTTGALAPVAC